MNKTIKDLAEMNGRVYVYLSDADIQKKFLEDAVAERFTFRDGTSPLDREPSDIYAINSNGTINYVGFAGRMAFDLGKEVGGRKLIKIDYRKWLYE